MSTNQTAIPRPGPQAKCNHPPTPTSLNHSSQIPRVPNRISYTHATLHPQIHRTCTGTKQARFTVAVTQTLIMTFHRDGWAGQASRRKLLHVHHMACIGTPSVGCQAVHPVAIPVSRRARLRSLLHTHQSLVPLVSHFVAATCQMFVGVLPVGWACRLLRPFTYLLGTQHRSVKAAHHLTIIVRHLDLGCQGGSSTWSRHSIPQHR